MEEKRYLKWYNKVGYGSGDFAGNVVYAFLSSFVMMYLTNTVGLNPGIIGTLIMVSKLFDGISDMFFGTMIDKTKSRLGKARPWMLYAYIGCAVTLVANFAIPDSLGTTAQYVWFFIAYTLLNAVFFTANNIAYASLVTFCTKNSRERVEMGSWRFIFAFSTSLLIQSVTVQFVRAAGGGAAAWRTVAVVYAIIGLIVNTISVFSIKELPEEELKAGKDHTEEKYGLIEAAKLLFSNKYYLMICATYICQQIYSAMLNMGIYYMIYILKNENLYSVFSWAINIPVIVAMCITPMLVEKMKGLYRMNFAGYVLGTVGRVGVIFAGYMGKRFHFMLYILQRLQHLEWHRGRVIWEQLLQAVQNILILQSINTLMELCIHAHLLVRKSEEESELHYVDGCLMQADLLRKQRCSRPLA